MSALWREIRAEMGSVLLDAPRYGLALRAPRLGRLIGLSWETLRNRGETLSRRPDQRGVGCEWRWTSSLRYCERRPAVGLRLLKAALAEWPIVLSGRQIETTSTPEVSFVVGHRGTERIPLLLATLASIAAQENTSVECIVVEQSSESLLSGLLPPWVRLVHTPPASTTMPYSRSWAFNVGARLARGECLILHDGDILVPRRYAAEAIAIIRRGFDAARLQRLIFYLSKRCTLDTVSRQGVSLETPPVAVVQNCQGGTLVVSAHTYWEIGAHDEGFLGWGGEDNEIFDRLQTRRIHDRSYLPFVHLHHDLQPVDSDGRPRRAYLDARVAIPAVVRIAELTARPSGLFSGPVFASSMDRGSEIPA